VSRIVDGIERFEYLALNQGGVEFIYDSGAYRITSRFAVAARKQQCKL